MVTTDTLVSIKSIVTIVTTKKVNMVTIVTKVTTVTQVTVVTKVTIDHDSFVPKALSALSTPPTYPESPYILGHTIFIHVGWVRRHRVGY